MLTDKNVPKIDGMRIDEAHKGGFMGSLLSPVTKLISKGTELISGKNERGPSVIEQSGITEQKAELADLKKKEKARIEAMNRSRRGRSSLLSGSEMGQAMKTTLGQ